MILKLFILISVFMVGALLQPVQAAPVTRIKDIISVEGVRDNMLVGYGLVVGLNGTGDKLTNSPFTKQSLTAMLERLGVNVRDQNLKTGNVAAVMVTATLPAFSNQGSRIDVSVSTLGDATSLLGGTLLVTPLLGADGQVYAVSQGPIAIGGFSASGESGSVTQNTPTNGRIPDGAIVEREIAFNLSDMQTVRLALRNPDLTTARRVASAINEKMGNGVAMAENGSSVMVNRPKNKSTVELLTDIEQLQVTPDISAKIVIDERSGVIVMGEDVRISTVAVAQGNLTVKITETPQVSQPNAFSQTGETKVVPRTSVDVSNGGTGNVAYLQPGVTLQELVTSLNAMGISPRDVISILQAIKTAGAIQAEIEVM